VTGPCIQNDDDDDGNENDDNVVDKEYGQARATAKKETMLYGQYFVVVLLFFDFEQLLKHPLLDYKNVYYRHRKWLKNFGNSALYRLVL
jgi:hypothetical protein